MALFRVDYSGRGELSERQQKLAQVRVYRCCPPLPNLTSVFKMLSKLTKLSEEYNVTFRLASRSWPFLYA
ncbi:hypothetical protein P691DRAFT_810787 [Macrolepiota fuliginosa MF-IS2]|uniref:Rad51-like C-terminal domain-containing protein n=1 Tax=Macrolepiota fuliginosa MF-IS2 TaxID=1400762 RepID=A0A9P5XPB6_9AGAR|nr:hypothetical protein P691DRAFT_810787 [Macrolepiota fuliginosa MF-IS2]